MDKNFVTIKQVRGITKLIYPLPKERGVYLLTGSNGSGKTSLLTVLDRLGNHQAFRNGLKDVGGKEASIEYQVQGKSVVYKRNRERWVPTPKQQSQLLGSYTYSKTYFLTATELRFYTTQENGNVRNRQNVSDEIKAALNRIFGTQKFNNLKYCIASSMRGRQSRLRRENKLYIIEESSRGYYTERSFSLGERMVLNALDFLETVEERGMLLVDEVELALHPVAQIKFYELLKEKAREKDLVVIISTHSSSLIKAADKVHYLENRDGHIQVIDNVKPAYILNSLSIERDNCPDYLFFVEDEMARIYLSEMLNCLRKEGSASDTMFVAILPVGGYAQVLKLMTCFYGVPPFTRESVYGFLDKDVKEKYEELEQKNNDRTSAEEDLFRLMRDHRSNYGFLPITPEQHIWEELKRDSEWFTQELRDRNQGILFDVGELISTVEREESKGSSNPRQRAKGCLKNLLDKVCERKPDITESVFKDILVRSYVRHRFEDEEFVNEAKRLIMPALNRRSRS